jgi:hypothetical protein
LVDGAVIGGAAAPGRVLFVVDVAGCKASWRRVAHRRPSGLGQGLAACSGRMRGADENRCGGDDLSRAAWSDTTGTRVRIGRPDASSTPSLISFFSSSQANAK